MKLNAVQMIREIDDITEQMSDEIAEAEEFAEALRRANIKLDLHEISQELKALAKEV